MKNLNIQINTIQIARFYFLVQLLLIGNFIHGQNKKEQIVLLQNKIDSLVSSHNKENMEHQNQIIELHAEIGKLKNEISNFQLKVNTSKSTIENYQVLLKQKSDSLNRLQTQFDSITKNLFRGIKET
jgi:peptidoglycan hydrolase CwlO-like protein